MFFQTMDLWPFDDKADLLNGWPIMEVHRNSWGASHDWYGKLFAYLRKEFNTFLKRLCTVSIQF
jgi:hypothetical protein